MERGLRRGFWLLAAALALLQAAPERFTLSSDDGVAYLDLGNAAWSRLDPGALVNGYWSPLYPVLQGAAARALHPTPYWEYPLANAVNLLTFALALVAFEWLLAEVLRARRIDPGETAGAAPDWPWLLAARALFLWSSLHWITVTSDTPDMLVAALVAAAAAMILRLARRPGGVAAWSGFGALLGLACLSKTAMFPLAPCFLVAGLVAAARARRPSWPMLAAPLALALLVAPLVASLSAAKGRLTFGDTGRLNYAWVVNPGGYRIPDKHWQGRPRAFGRPLHPTRRILEQPPTYEFATPVGGTFPPWTDPSYWFDGLRLRFSLGRQLEVASRNLDFLLEMFGGGLAVTLALLVGLAEGVGDALRCAARGWPLWLPGLAGLGLYLVGTDLRQVTFHEQPSTRLVAPFAVMLCVGLALHARPRATRGARRAVACASLALAAVLGARLAAAAVQDAGAALRGVAPRDFRVARAVGELGVSPGDPVAIANAAFAHGAWAHLARVRIVAQTGVGDRLWILPPEQRTRLLDALAGAGVRALVLASASEPPEPGWTRLAGTRYYARLLPVGADGTGGAAGTAAFPRDALAE